MLVDAYYLVDRDAIWVDRDRAAGLGAISGENRKGRVVDNSGLPDVVDEDLLSGFEKPRIAQGRDGSLVKVVGLGGRPGIWVDLTDDVLAVAVDSAGAGTVD